MRTPDWMTSEEFHRYVRFMVEVGLQGPDPIRHPNRTRRGRIVNEKRSRLDRDEGRYQPSHRI